MVTGVVLVVVVAAWYLALWSPRQKAIKKATADATAAQANVSVLLAELSALQAQARSQTQRQIELTRLRAAIPTTADISSVIVSLYNAASDAGIDLTSISDSQPEAGTPPSVKISLAVTGHFYQVLQFLNDLAGLPRIVVIDNVALAPGGGASGAPKVGISPTLSVTLSGRVFVTSAPSKAGAGASTTSPGTPNTVPGSATTVPTTSATTSATTSTAVQVPSTTTSGTTGRPQ